MRNGFTQSATNCIKLHNCLAVDSENANGEICRLFITVPTGELCVADNLNEWYDELIEEYHEKLIEFREGRSGLALKEIVSLAVNILACNPILVGASTYF